MSADNEISMEDFSNLSEKGELAQAFDSMILTLGGDLPRPTPEYKFHALRKWRFDRAWPDHFIAVEIEGGIYSGGRHVRGKGFENDCEKYNLAQRLGWKVYRFTSSMITTIEVEKIIKELKSV